MESYSNITLDEREMIIPPAYKSTTSYGWSSENTVREPPSAYTSNVAYEPSPYHEEDPTVYDPARDNSMRSFQLETDLESLKSSHEDVKRSKNMKPLYIFWFLSKSRYYVRGIAILVMILSMSLILSGVVKFSNAKKYPAYNTIPKPASGITDHPCIVFTGVAVMNLVISATVLLISCLSSKFRKSNNAITAVFTIISAIGFSTSMGACFFLNKQTTLENDLWKWSCGNQQKGITSPAIDFGQVCSIIAYSWRFGLVQASLELLTFIISCMTFVLLKYSNFVKFGFF